MFKTILVPVDLAHADKSHDMIEKAKQLADQNDSQLTLLNVIPEMPSYVASQMPSGLHQKVMDTAKNELAELARKHDVPETATLQVKHGNVAQVILGEAERSETDLIVIASHQPGLSDYLLGSVAGKVVRHAHCSVLVLR
ncbi:MAG: universal stress protein [Hyphomicrobiaceae bacterium]